MARRFLSSYKEIYCFVVRIFGLKYRVKNKIIKGLSLRKNDCEITVQNRFQIFKAASTTTAQPPIVVSKSGVARRRFIVPLWKCSCICPLAFISSCKYGDNIQFLLVRSSKICVHFKLIFGLHAGLLDRQDVAFSIINALRNIHYCYPSCPPLG